eukprot:SAG31_NODE_581_length_13927_cov_78.549899_7_plen_66_part_00
MFEQQRYNFCMPAYCCGVHRSQATTSGQVDIEGDRIFTAVPDCLHPMFEEHLCDSCPTYGDGGAE